MKARLLMKSTLLAAVLPLFAGMFFVGCGGENTGIKEDPNPAESKKFAEEYEKQMQKEMEEQMKGGKK